MIIRTAEEKDMPELLDIYNYEVEHGLSTFDLNPKTMEERLVWFRDHNVGNHPLIVAEEDGKSVGYASLSSYRPKEAYAATVELSVYIDKNYRRRGIAGKLASAILEIARERDDIHTVISVITGENEASIRLHERLGFIHCGTINEVGLKFGKMLNIENFQLMV
ncbi:MAG TPA: GNAT family N-acetyltransferase [Lachnoclostridium sp.]|jgi:L-amino acid N-acyltransferase YncA|uniref:GNAT family N-acetyltransferase n=1 Tax=Lacrimispora sp. TaxID=2719234 RepID=UPI000EE4FD53|nr:N-acetyltransferase family protein [Lacrimispora sp.]HCD46745.1 GNAT family N-acetyltransferase [Lachnoclostridium sp.]